jgi:hypothetical protein
VAPAIGTRPLGRLAHIEHLTGPFAQLARDLPTGAGDDPGDLAGMMESALDGYLERVLASLEVIEHTRIVGWRDCGTTRREERDDHRN